MKHHVNSPCCVCGTTNAVRAFGMRYPEQNYPGTFELHRCTNCGLLFNSPRLSAEELRRLYDRDYYVFGADSAAELARVPDIFRRTVALTEGTVSARKVLEIGCAKGYLLALLSRLGWDVTGVEISPDAAAYVRSRFDLPVFTGTVEEFVGGGGRRTFPLVVAVDVIEHVPDPRAFTESVGELLDEGGVFVVDTPNGSARNIEILGEQWEGFNPFHIYLFSPDNLCRLLQENGLAVETVFSYGNQPANPALTDSGKSGNRERLRLVLLSLGLYRMARRLFWRVKRLASCEEPLEERLRTAAIRAKEGGDYFSSLDSVGPLATGCGGDNFVVIARKST